MVTFTLPAACRMRITASMEPKSGDRHQWSVKVHADGAADGADPSAQYGSRIGGGETQRIDAAPLKTDSRCEVLSTYETPDGWTADVGKVTVSTPDDLSITFQRPEAIDVGGVPQACVLAFEFSPAIPA